MKLKNQNGAFTISHYPNRGVLRLIKKDGQFIVCPLSPDDPYSRLAHIVVFDEEGECICSPNPVICPVLRVECEWDDSIIPVLKQYSIKGLDLNISYGWKCFDYSFLSRIPLMQEISILSGSVERIDYLESQRDLKSISLQVWVEDGSRIDFSHFTKLTHLFCVGQLVNQSLFSCSSLTYLGINELWNKEDYPFENLTNLKELEISNSSLSDISFLSSMISIVKLSMDDCRSVKDFSPISSLIQLRSLMLRGVILRDLSFISLVPMLKILVIDTGKVDSIKPLVNLHQLRALSLGAIILDKDLTPIDCLINLSILFIKNKKDYPYHINNHWNWNDYGQPKSNWLKKK